MSNILGPKGGLHANYSFSGHYAHRVPPLAPGRKTKLKVSGETGAAAKPWIRRFVARMATTGTRAACLTTAWLLTGVGVSSVYADDISIDARRAISVIDSLQVEQHWPAGVHVNWETGIPDGKMEVGMGLHTHCSAFIAEAAKRLGIYILRPPEHGQMLLANAQYDWLAQDGSTQGWLPVEDAMAAQALANRGLLVVASYKNPRRSLPGHIAIVRPSSRSTEDMRKDGPEITQAGKENYRSTSLKHGFAGHPLAWKNHEVRYYAHRIDSAMLSSP